MKVRTAQVFNASPARRHVKPVRIRDQSKEVAETLKQQFEQSVRDNPPAAVAQDAQSKLDVTA